MTQDSVRISVEGIREQIPYYLTQEQKEGLAKALSDFPEGMNYYTIMHKEATLQGDGWTSLQVINFDTLERKSVRGIILSNSCDITPENTRDLPVKIAFVPIIKLESFAQALRENKVSEDRITDKIIAIKNQRITSIFYLPKGENISEDYIALLDDVHSMPSSKLFSDQSREKVFTLSQAGFYLFLLKLSIHFCRFHEGVFRDAA